MKPYACDDPEGYELIRFTGAISALELDDEPEFWEREKLPFGFRAPERAQPVSDVPSLASAAWSEWLDTQ